MKLILFCLVFSLSGVSYAATATSSPETIAKFLLPRLNSKTHETQRKKNELLVDVAYQELKNKPGYALAFLYLDDNKPDTRTNTEPIGSTSSWSDMISNEEHKYFFEVYLLKTSPQLSVVATGTGSFEKICDCADSEKSISISLEDSMIPLGKKDSAFIVTAVLPTGGMSSTWGDDTYLNAFRIEGQKIIHIWNALKESNFESSGRYEDGPKSTNTVFKFIPTTDSWILEGTDENFLYDQTVPIRKVYIWDEKSHSIKEIADEKRASLLCTEEQLKKAEKIAKTKQKHKKYSEASLTIENAIEKCSEYPAFSKAVWLESDLLLYLFKEEEYRECVTTAETLETRKDFSSRPQNVREAIAHNKKLCAEKIKTPAL